jgi:hypothetical protein
MTILTVSCVFTLATLLFAGNSPCEEKNERREAPVSMCQTIFLESNGRKWAGNSHPNAADPAPLRAPEANVISFARTRAFAGPVPLEMRKKLLESSLVDWIFYEDLSDKQRAVLDRASFNCAESPTETATAAVLFDRFSASQRATFVAITHALMNTSIVDAKGRDETVDALGLVEEMTDVHGENQSSPSDQQFQLFARLMPDALPRLRAANNFEIGENRVFHPGYPLSFRQVRRFAVRGQEAGLHISIARDGRSAVIHIDYRFWILHLWPANSDVRAPGNHEKHVDRWPQAVIAARSALVQRVVLEQADPQQP